MKYEEKAIEGDKNCLNNRKNEFIKEMNIKLGILFRMLLIHAQNIFSAR